MATTLSIEFRFPSSVLYIGNNTGCIHWSRVTKRTHNRPFMPGLFDRSRLWVTPYPFLISLFLCSYPVLSLGHFLRRFQTHITNRSESQRALVLPTLHLSSLMNRIRSQLGSQLSKRFCLASNPFLALSTIDGPVFSVRVVCAELDALAFGPPRAIVKIRSV